MVVTRADKRLFIGAFMAGAAVWGAFALFNTEPWDTLYGVAALLALGLALGYAGDTHPVLWAIGLFLGQAAYGLASLAMGSGGTNFFLPLGLAFLVPFTVPALVGSLAGAALKRRRW